MLKRLCGQSSEKMARCIGVMAFALWISGEAQSAQSGAASAIPPEPACVTQAAQFHQVNNWILRAIIWQESKNDAQTLRANSNNSIDYGHGGINSVHLQDLRKYGITPDRLMQPCVNTYVAAWLLAKSMKRYGNTWQAVGAYHSNTPERNIDYARTIQAILVSWGVIGLPGQIKP